MRQSTPRGEPRPILAIDCGSSSVRVTEVSVAAGVTMRELRRAPTPWHRGDPARAEINLRTLTALLWRLLSDAERDLSAPPRAIAVTAVLGWVPLDRDGTPVGDAVTYADRRSVPLLGELARRLPRFSVEAGRPLTAELLLPIDVAAGDSRPAAWTSLKDYILSLLGGDPGVDEIHAAYSGFSGEEAIAVTGRGRSPFAEVGPADVLCGRCRGPGRLDGVPLARGTSDGSAGFYAITAIRDDSAMGGRSGVEPPPALLVSGTTEVVMAPWYGSLPPDGGSSPDHAHLAGGLVINPAIASLLPGARAVIGGSTGTVGGLLRHVTERFGGDPVDHVRLQAAAAAVPPGAAGLMVFPALQGERLPRSIPGHAAAVLGVGPATGPGEFARALWEAGAFRLDGILEEITALTGTVPSSLRVGGGGGENALWNQIRADVTGITLRRLPWREASTVGSVWIALAALGEDPRSRAVDPKNDTRWEPDESLRARYRHIARGYRERAEILARWDRENQEGPV